MMAGKKSPIFAVRRTKCLRSLGLVKPAMGDGLMCGAVVGFLLGLAIGINRKKSGEDLGTFAIEYGIRGSVLCAFVFGLVFALRLGLKV